MIKSNLPVILLKGLVVLPFGEARVELNNSITKKVIDISKLYHDNEVLIVTPINDLEENPDTSDLPRVGVVAKITSRIDLPNGNTRIVLSGAKRVRIVSYVNYSNEKEVLESIITGVKEDDYDEIEETALLRKLINELDKFISINPYISNSILNQIKGITDLEKLTDNVANFLPLTFEKRLNFALDFSRRSRAKKLIKEINIELAILELENKIELDLKSDLDEMQKEMILKEKIKIIKKELGEKDSKTEYIEVIKEKLNNSVISDDVRKRILNELERYSVTPEVSPELAVIRSYIDYLISIPWGKFTKDESDLNVIKNKLDKTHYGLTKVKERILEYIAVKLNNKNAPSPIICLVGPPGVGKTTLAESIAKCLNKNFAKISLGGINDPAELIGHRKTYIGSSPGKIISALIKSDSMNPVILLDEIDKLSKDYKGDPSSALLDLLDTNQNSSFVDNYIEEKVNLNNVTWILTANDINSISPILLDRLEIIYIDAYLDYEKVNIVKNYLIKRIKEKNGITNVNISISNSTIYKIIDGYTKESGVRELERLLNKIIRKIITENKFNNKKITNIVIKEKDLINYLSTVKYLPTRNSKSKIGFAKALAANPYGGSILEIEVTSYPGKEEFITTGSLGEVLKESIKISLSYIKSHLDDFGIEPNKLDKTIHLNFREGALPKDGPSAGTIITTTILSYLLDKKIPSNISMTGEMTLLGDVLPVGAIREKSYAAIKNGISTVFLSCENKRNVVKLDTIIKNKIKFVFVDNYMEIYDYIFKGGSKDEGQSKN